MKNRQIILLMLSTLALPPWLAARAGDIASITVQEALPAGVSGLARQQAPVTVGIPLPETSGISSVSQLGMSTSAAQFRALAHWPNGNIKWVLADFQSTLDAGGSMSNIVLKTGSGSFGGAPLAADAGATITVDTGAAQFTIRKAAFNLFDSVSIGGQSLVMTGNNGGLRAYGLDNAEYASSNDASSTAVLEENGPVRAVVRAKGSLKSIAGTRLLDYTVRLHFYSGKTYAKAQLFLRNASKLYPGHVAFKSVEAVVPLSLSGAKTVHFSRKSDVVSRALPSGATASLYQGYNQERSVFLETDCYTWAPPVPGTCNGSAFTHDAAASGLEIKVGSEVINSLGSSMDWTQGYADLSEASGKGATLALRWMSSYWPSGFEFKDNGEAAVEIYSKRNSGIPEKFLFGKHERREVIWNFHSSAVEEKQALYALQYPLIGRAPFSYYADSRAIFGQKEFVSAAQQSSYFTSYGRTPPSLANPAMSTIYRTYYWALGGGTNQTDIPFSDLIDFLRTGSPGFYLLGEQRTLYTADSAVPRGDDFTTEKIWVTGTDPLPSGKTSNGPFIDTDHSHIVSIPFYYFLSGDEAVKDGFLDYGEYLQYQQNNGIYAIPDVNNYDLRSVGRKLRNTALAYEFTCQTASCNPTYKTTLENALSVFVDMRDNPAVCSRATKGFNLERGYFWWDDKLPSTAPCSQRLIHSLYLVPIFYEALFQAWRVIRETNPAFPKLFDIEDRLTGLARFIMDEYLTARLPADPLYSSGYRYYIRYDYVLDEALQTSSLYSYTLGRAATWAYEQTGNPDYLGRGGFMTWQATEGGYPRNPSDLQDQVLMYTSANQAAVPIYQTLPISVQDNGGGSYTLTWTVPPGAQNYRIKYSDKTVVDWLGFDKSARTYQFDPAQYVAYSAAQNVTSPPAPGAPGSLQSFTVTGLNLTKSWHFMVKSLAPPPGADTTAPTVSITAPVEGASVQDTVPVNVVAADANGVTRVELYVDGALYATDTAAPFSFSWDTMPVASGIHTLTAKAYDVVGNSASTASLSVRVKRVPKAPVLLRIR